MRISGIPDLHAGPWRSQAGSDRHVPYMAPMHIQYGSLAMTVKRTLHTLSECADMLGMLYSGCIIYCIIYFTQY